MTGTFAFCNFDILLFDQDIAFVIYKDTAKGRVAMLPGSSGYFNAFS